MEFVDHYAALNISQNATENEIMAAYFTFLDAEASEERFRSAAQARNILMNKKERANYDKTFGYLMVIQTEPAKYINGVCYQLLKPDDAHIKLLSIIESFKSWVTKKTSLEWDEAQQENYSVDFHSSEYAPYVILRCGRESDVADFAKKLTDERLIK